MVLGALAVWANPFPVAAAHEATVVDEAFRVLMVLAVPVFAFVVVVLVYSILRFRIRGEPGTDGPPLHSNRMVIALWLVVTTGLTLLVIVFPGVTGLQKLTAEEKEDLVVQVQGSRFFWKITYPEYGVSSFGELVLPVNQRARFEVTATDVLHSFWVPAFRMKIDAVPGLTTVVHATPDRTGSFEDDSAWRLQCAELCGIGHTIMTVPVRVVGAVEFQAWIAQQPRMP